MAALLMPRRNKGMRTRLGCLSHKSDSCSDFTAILPDKPNRALKRLSTEEATRWADSFDVLLSHKCEYRFPDPRGHEEEHAGAVPDLF
ncbi:rCG46567, isoform CRA_d [Rattus norvegicus]|uniref:RCG46567, isoform CRA_d n=1 Tax=Rattus norvegicus TaxID=10116 RepID=A6ICV5_RAT|nr:rCG46567, isoform CRA_d [Rattus norvegicus]EDM09543.1 rCG46567, isoform CRA_d [Rattus norvegicus]EDM09544.1 rCG46567, isoform CRA_d [Rattus norvegicus]